MSENAADTPVSSGQFISFEIVASFIAGLLVIMCAVVWNTHMSDFDKTQTKLDTIIVSLAKIETQMTNVSSTVNKLSDDVSDNTKSIVALNAKTTYLEKTLK